MVLEKDRLFMYLKWIDNAITKISDYTKDINISKLESHWIILDWCMMQLIHIGETANKIIKKHPKFKELPLEEMVKLRNFAAHDYLGINTSIIKNVITKELPKIQKIIKQIDLN